MNIRKGILGSLLLLAAIAGCTKQRDLDVISSPLVELRFDWSRARITPDIWTVMFYGDNAAAPRSFVTDRIVDTLQLSPDSYKTLVINGMLSNGIDYVRFRGTNSYDTFEAYATTNLVKPNGDIVVNEPDTLAGTALLKTVYGENKFTVKYVDGKPQPGDTGRYVSDVIEYAPCRLVYRIKVTVTIENIDRMLASRKITGEIRGLSGGVLVASRMPTHNPVVYSLAFENNNPPSATVGTVETAFATFGPPLDLTEQRAYDLVLAFVLTNNRIYKISTDVSDQVDAIAAQIKDRIDRGVCDAGLDLEIKINVALPTPSNDNTEVDLNPWGDDENQDIFL